jgi:hypothetical protein
VDHTFARELEIFSESSGGISSENFERLIIKVAAYAKKILHVHKLEMLIHHHVDGDRMLYPVIDQEDLYKAYPVHTGGKPNGINAFAYLTDTPVWIVSSSSSEQILTKVDSYRDLWSDSASHELPHFQRFESKRRGWEQRENTRTLISIPIIIDRHYHSVVYFESNERLLPSERAKQEFFMIATSISLLRRKVDFHKEDSSRLLKSINRLADTLIAGKFFYTTPLFFGYSERADQRVISMIHNALKKHDIPFNDWALEFGTGDIRSQIFQNISECRAGILYFSEPSTKPDCSSKYVDNTNVIFEAGMLQYRAFYAKSNLQLGVEPSFLGWLGVREKNSDPLPFDLAGERIVTISRLEDGTLLERESEILLDKFLTTLLGRE